MNQQISGDFMQDFDKGDMRIVQLLVEHGADINLKPSDYQVKPLERAIYNGNVSIVNYLLEQGADVSNMQELKDLVEYIGTHSKDSLQATQMMELLDKYTPKQAESYWLPLGILQYHRGFKPFIDVIKYKETKLYIFKS